MKVARGVGVQIAVVAVVGSGVGFAMARMRSTPPARNAPAKIDLGAVPAGALRRFQFEVANPASRESDVHVVAGCGVELEKTDLIVPARGRVSVVGWALAPASPGRTSYRVDYRVGSLKASSVGLSLDVQPASRWISQVDLPDVRTGEGAGASLRFTPPPSWRGARMEWTVDGRPLLAKSVPAATLVAHDRWTAPVVPGRQERVYEVHPVGDASVLYRRTATYRVVSRYPIGPSSANLGLLPNPNAEVTVRVSGSPPRLKVEQMPAGIAAALRGHRLVIKPKGSKPVGKLISGQVTLSTADPREPRIQVPTFAFWKP
jgi:hypothetical protein